MMDSEIFSNYLARLLRTFRDILVCFLELRLIRFRPFFLNFLIPVPMSGCLYFFALCPIPGIFLTISLRDSKYE